MKRRLSNAQAAAKSMYQNNFNEAQSSPLLTFCYDRNHYGCCRAFHSEFPPRPF